MEDLQYFLQHIGTDPSRLIFEDELTGLYNRRFLLNYFEHKLNWDALEAEPVSLLMLDVDRFKQINDTHGHDIGDQALIWVAKLMKKAAGEDGLSVRYAGDEFIILMKMLRTARTSSIRRTPRCITPKSQGGIALPSRERFLPRKFSPRPACTSWRKAPSPAERVNLSR